MEKSSSQIHDPGFTSVGCTQCGARVADDAACDALFHDLGMRFQQDMVLVPLRTLLVDAYCCQHERYIRSAKSYAAHIVGLCLALEFGQMGPSASTLLSRWLNGRGPDLVKPAGSIPRASMTISEVAQGRTADELAAGVSEFAKSVWGAWRGQHEIARGWARAVQSLR